MTNIDDFSAWHHGAIALKHHIIAFRDDITSSVSTEDARIMILNSALEFRSWQISADIILDQLCCQCQATMEVYQSTRVAYLSMKTAMMLVSHIDLDDIDIETDFHLPTFFPTGHIA